MYEDDVIPNSHDIGHMLILQNEISLCTLQKQLSRMCTNCKSHARISAMLVVKAGVPATRPACGSDGRYYVAFSGAPTCAANGVLTRILSVSFFFFLATIPSSSGIHLVCMGFS